MLPGFVDSAYKQYRRDTSTFFKWLLETGERVGYSTDVKESVQPDSGIILLSRDEIGALAEKIAMSGYPWLDIPFHVLDAIVRALILRRRFIAFFRSEEISETVMELAIGHSQFVFFMEEMLLILVHGVPTLSDDGSEDCWTSDIVADIEGRLSATLGEDVPTEKPDHTGDNSNLRIAYYIDYLSDDVEKQEEKVFAIWCMIDDMQKLRTVIQRTWNDYLLTRSNSMISSMITNTAFQLAFQIQEELLAEYPDCGILGDVVNIIWSLVQRITGETTDLECPPTHSPLSQWMFRPVSQILQVWVSALKKYNGVIPERHIDAYGSYIPAMDRRNASSSEKFGQDLIILSNILCEFAFLQKHNLNLMAHDELTKGLRKLCADHKISTWLGFAVTSFLDIHHIMKDRTSEPATDLRVNGINTLKIYEKHLEFSNCIPYPPNWASFKMALQIECLNIKDTILNDITFPRKAEVAEERHLRKK